MKPLRERVRILLSVPGYICVLGISLVLFTLAFITACGNDAIPLPDTPTAILERGERDTPTPVDIVVPSPVSDTPTATLEKAGGNTPVHPDNNLPKNVVVESEGGQWVLVNELVILTSGQDVTSLIAEFGGEITISVPETGSYQVRFPVSNLDELNMIKKELEKKRVQAVYVIVMRPPSPGGPE